MLKRNQKYPDSFIISFLKLLLPSGRLKWLSWIAIVFSLWLILYPEPYKPLLIISLLLPVLGLIINRLISPDFESLLLIRTDTGKESYCPVNFIIFPAIALLIRDLSYS
ncbi:hypothetical protein, partial [uncultured Mucilaginibacter sp.]|uniref:hypothetical protein n=1 Tax=uncultured Mucilaginibacter sp. TaxID=797541 RepID=UPI0025CDBA38